MFSQLSGPLAQQLTLALLHFLWQGTVVAALLAAVLSVVRSLHRRYLASVLAMLAMAVLPVVTFCVLTTPGGDVAETRILPADATARSEIPESDEAAIAASEASIQAGDDPSRHLQLAHWAAWLQPYALSAWLAGVLVLNVRLLSSWLGTLWLRGGRAPLDGALPRRIADLAQRMGMKSRPNVFSSARIHQAMVVGLWRPLALVPLAWLSELPLDVLEAVIAHELAHIRRQDLWITWMQRLVESLLFFHPAVWWISRQITQEREMCCDELAVRATGRRLAYAKALETVGRRRADDEAFLLATSFHGETNMNLLARVRRVLGQGPQPETGSAWVAGLVLFAVALGLGLMVASSGRASQAEQEKERERPAAESGRGRSPEAETGRRRSAEAEAGPRRSAEAEAGRRRSPEAEAGTRRSAEEGEGRRQPRRDERDAGPNALRDFEPQNDREAALVGVIKDLQQQLNDLRREVRALRGQARPRDGEGPRRVGPRDGEGPRRAGPRDGEGPPKPGPRDGEGPRRPGPRDGEGPPKPGPRDGEGPPKPAQGDA